MALLSHCPFLTETKKNECEEKEATTNFQLYLTTNSSSDSVRETCVYIVNTHAKSYIGIGIRFVCFSGQGFKIILSTHKPSQASST